MGRTNWIILALGLGACLALSLMMQHLVGVHQDVKRPPLAKEIDAVYGRKLAAPVSMVLEGPPGRRRLELGLRPVEGIRVGPRLLQDLADFVWGGLPAGEHVDAVVLAVELTAGPGGAAAAVRGGDASAGAARVIRYQVFPRSRLRAARELSSDDDIAWGARLLTPPRPAAETDPGPAAPPPRGR